MCSAVQAPAILFPHQAVASGLHHPTTHRLGLAIRNGRVVPENSHETEPLQSTVGPVFQPISFFFFLMSRGKNGKPDYHHRCQVNVTNKKEGGSGVHLAIFISSEGCPPGDKTRGDPIPTFFNLKAVPPNQLFVLAPLCSKFLVWYHASYLHCLEAAQRVCSSATILMAIPQTSSSLWQPIQCVRSLNSPDDCILVSFTCPSETLVPYLIGLCHGSALLTFKDSHTYHSQPFIEDGSLCGFI